METASFVLGTRDLPLSGVSLSVSNEGRVEQKESFFMFTLALQFFVCLCMLIQKWEVAS